MRTKNYILSVLLLFFCSSMMAQNYLPFNKRFDRDLRGDMLLIGNNTLNRDNGGGSGPNTSYNGSGQNGSFDMQYVDIDGDASTFCSSSSVLTVPVSAGATNCSRIIYAGLYWSGLLQSGSRTDIDKVKFKTPVGGYNNITGQIIYDANVAPIGGNRPYACYADVTALTIAGGSGTYTVGNIQSSVGSNSGTGLSAGWSLFVVYEDPSLTSKAIVSYEGFSALSSATGLLNIPISGFRTIPAGPVNAKFAFMSLEGDQSITGDYLQINGLAMFGGTRVANNFFNSSITPPGVRVPNGTNLLGWDAGIINVPNPGNGTIANNANSATVTLGSTGDVYFHFFNAFDVEIIEPKITLTKVVQNTAGVDIANTNVVICQDLNYKISFQNIGNDDAINFTIRDVLPTNITFNPALLVLPAGVTYTYNAGTRTIIFTIANNLVNAGDPISTITIPVKVVCTCLELDDACSNVIRNQAFATYQGVLSGTQITDDPSLSAFSICNQSPPSPTNTLVDLDLCNFSQDVVLCGTTVTLTAANGYESYVWTGPGTITPVAGTNNQSVIVSQVGLYTVHDNINLSPCRSIIQTFNVVDITGVPPLTNPVLPYADQIVVCPNDNVSLPLIFLCGASDCQLISTTITGATSISWEQLNTASCAAVANPNCANTNPLCSWTAVGAGANYNACTAGEYRVVINYPGGCSRIFYFNVFKNLLNPIATATPIFCSSIGAITITGVPAVGYEYQLNCAGPWQTNPVFSPLPVGTYSVCVRQVGVANGCVFTLSNISIVNVNTNYSVTAVITQPLCFGQKGCINVAANNGLPQYTFSIFQGATLISAVGPTNTANNLFCNLSPGNYTYVVTTSSGCSTTVPFTINNPTSLTATVGITKPLTACGPGEITVVASGGTPFVLPNPNPYIYVVTGAVTVTQGTPIIVAPVAGTYNIQVVDANNCFVNVSQVVVNSPPPVFTIVKTDILCASAGNTGAININVSNANGAAILYSINNGVTFFPSSSFTNLAAGTYNVVLQYTLGTSVCTTVAQPITIIAPTLIAGISTLTTPFTCTTNGVITVSGVTGGTPGYTYSINGVTYQVGTTFTILGPGTYTITIKDGAGCTFATLPIVVAPLTPPTDLSFTSTALTCPTNVSTVTLTTTGGSAPLTYQILLPVAGAAQASNIFANLAPNTYTFLVRDSKNCTYQESYTIAPLPVLGVVGNLVSNVRCFGTATGSATFTVSNTTGFTYTINGVAQGVGVSPITLVNQLAGTYTIVVTNTATNCTATTSVTIVQPAAALAVTLTPSPVTCLANGQVVVNASGGWGGNVYTISPVAGTLSGNTFSNLPAGAYVVTTTDSGGCAVTANFNLVLPTPPTASISALSDFCYDSTNGASIVVTAAGGIVPYTYSINGLPFQVSNTFSNLTPGVYTIIVRDSFGCTVTLPIQTIASQITLNTVLTKDLDCTASPNAVITGTIGAGYPAYTYQVSFNAGPFGAAIPVVGAGFVHPIAIAGTYQFLVTDTRGCTVLSTVHTINALVPVAATHIKVDNLCFGATSGSVTITPSGGVGPYVISFNGSAFTATTTYSGLVAGVYPYIVRDSKSCTFNGSVTITQPALIAYTAIINPIQCAVAGGYTLGSICVNALTGGTAPFIYTLVDLTGGTANQTFVSAAGANHCFTNIDFGMYDLSVKDANGCTIVKSNLIMSNPPSDLTFVVNPLGGTCAAGSSVTVTLVGALGFGPFEFAIMNAPPPLYVVFPNAFVPASSPPFTHLFTGLTPGAIFTIVVRDITTGCYYFEQMTAPTATSSTITVTPLVANPVPCRGGNNGSVTFSLAGINAATTSINYSVHYASNNLPVGAATNGTLLGPGFVFPVTVGPLAPGTYNIQFTEIGGVAISGCGVTSANFTITESATDLTLSATTTNDNCNVNAGHISPTVIGGTGPYTFQYLLWSPLAPPAPTAISPGWVATNPFNGESGTYDVYVKDAFGCIKTVTVVIGLDSTPVISAPIVNACVAQGTYQINVIMTTAGVAPYTFSIDGGAYVANVAPFIISGLSSGPHTVQVRDRNGCGNLVAVNILPPLVVSAVFTIQPTCLNSNGTVTATASGGSAPANYIYTLLTPASVVLVGPQASPTFINQPAGCYIIRVTDSTTGCSANTPFCLALPTLPTFTAVPAAVSCNGGSDGTITINLIGLNNDPPYTYQINAPALYATGPQNSNIFTGLPAGTYTVQVNSGRVCSTIDNNVVIGTPMPVVASGLIPPFTCAANNSVNVSVLTVTGAGGTPGYTYSIDGINYFPTNTFNIINNGAVQNITVYVKDLKGCIDTDAIIVNPLPFITAATVAQTTAITCNNPELVTITVTGGSGNFTYQALPSGAANVVQILATNQFNITGPGTYFFQVNDVTTGCYFATLAYTVLPFNTIDVVATATTPVTCFGNSNGAMTINVTGYVGVYSYNVIDNTTLLVVASGVGNTAVLNPRPIVGLPAGNYTVQVTETASPFCVKISNVITIASPSAALTLTASETSNVTCNNNAGVITATVTGGWGTYTYSMLPFPAGAVQTGNVFSNLPAGNYTITVTDLLNCSVSTIVPLVLPLPIATVFTPSANSVLCFGDNSVTISFPYPTGGQGSNYSYILHSNNPSVLANGPVLIPNGAVTNITGLGADTYTIDIIDGFGCSLSSLPIVITQPAIVTASLAINTTQTCINQTSLTLTGSGGTPPYTYSTTVGGPYVPFVPAAATSTTISVPVGTHHYFIRDANGCTSVVSGDVVIDPLTPLTFSTLTSQNILCGGSATGTISAVANGGLGNYVYTLLDGLGNPIVGAIQLTPGNFSNLTAGSYIVHVQSIDCPFNSPVIIISEPTPFTVVPTSGAVKCNGDSTGFINLIMAGGTGAIQYSISPNLGQFFTIANPYAVGGFNVPNLSAGNYTIIVQDQNGCLPFTFNMVIGQPTALTSNIASHVDEVCAEQDLGEILVNGIGGGTPPYSITYTVIYPGTTAVVTSATIPLAPGVTSYNFTGLNGGEYTTIVTDANGCKSENQQIIDSGVLYNPRAEVTFPCVNNLPGVRVEVINLSNAPNFTFDPLANYLFSLDVNNSASAQTSNIFTSATYASLLTPGPHTIYVFNANGCDKATQVFTISPTDVDPLTLTLSQGGLNIILATSTGGSGGNTYTFNGYNNGSVNTYVYDHTGDYTVTVTDNTGCSKTVTKPFIFVPIKIDNVFTPDGNGTNDGWGPKNTSNYKNILTKIYDRYGRVVAELKEGELWYGKYNGNEMPSGDYWYVIKIDAGNDEEYVGHFTLYR